MEDFNFYRSLENRNRTGGNLNDINIFNAIISNLGLMEIPLKGRKYTWNNMQDNPLMEQLDWCFTSLGWTTKYPNTLLLPMAKPTSDHVPCVAQIGTSIPKAQTFRFENYWIHYPRFTELVQSVWNTPITANNSTTLIAAKFKLLRRVLKRWSKGISKLTILVKKCNEILLVMDKLKEQRPLTIQESNFRKIIKNQITKLLKYQNEYRRQRYTVRWVKFGDKPTKFFMASAAKRYRMNTITSIQDGDGREITDHAEKAVVLWNTYKDRMGKSLNPVMLFDLNEMIHTSIDLDSLQQPFTREEIDQVIKEMPAEKAPGPDGFNALFEKNAET